MRYFGILKHKGLHTLSILEKQQKGSIGSGSRNGDYDRFRVGIFKWYVLKFDMLTVKRRL